MSASSFRRSSRTLFYIGIGVSLAGCPAAKTNDTPSPAPSGETPNSERAPSAAATSTAAAENGEGKTRFFAIRRLLREKVENFERAKNLYPLVAEVCEQPEAQAEFLEDAGREAAREGAMARIVVAEMVEHIAVSCSRNAPPVAIALLEKAEAKIGEPYRLKLVRSRLLASIGNYAAAEKVAQEARANGSVRAIALIANLQAEAARLSAKNGAPDLNAAIQTVQVEPDGAWQLIDLTAVLSSRARLLTERALFEAPAQATQTLIEARSTYERLGQTPFPAQIRALNLDVLCFESVDLPPSDFAACAKAAEFGNLGAAFLANVRPDPRRIEPKRIEAMQRERASLETLPEGSVALVVVRGDHAEVTSWARASVQALRLLRARRAKFVIVDRTDPQTAPVVRRIWELADLRPSETVSGGQNMFTVPCVSTVLAGQPAPANCPLPAAQLKRLSALGPFGVGVLIGRDLDAEIDNLADRKQRILLLSLRIPQTTKPVDLQLANLSDVWIMSPRAAALSGKPPPPPDAGVPAP